MGRLRPGGATKLRVRSRGARDIVALDAYLDVLVLQLVDEDGDRVEAVVRGRVARRHFAAALG